VLTFDIIVEDLSVSLSAPFTIDCINESAPLFASLNLDLDATYTWTYNSEVIAEGDNLDSFNALEAGTYELSVDVMGVCTDEISADVIADFTVHNVNILDPETLNCLNESIQLIGTYNGNAAYVEWWLGNTNIESGINQLVLDANSSGEYTFIVYHEFTGCPSQDSVTVQADYTTPSVSVGNQDSLSCIFPSIPIQNISIESSNAFSTNWSTTDGVLAGNTNSIDIFAAAPGTYTLTVQDDISGCEREVDVYVGASATYDLDLSSLSFPNIMSANGDGKNDRWYPFLRDSPSANLSRIFETYDLLIYNRWGQVVFESNSYNSAFSAKDLPDSVYYYSLKYSTTCDGGTTGNVEGYIEVLR
jgi:gliding motility-associated-like protein